MFNMLKDFRKLFAPAVTAEPSRPKLRRTILEVEWLEKRELLNADTLVWEPQSGSTNANLSSNWWDQTQNVRSMTAPTASNPIVLDGSVSNSAITTNAPLNCMSLLVQNGYSKTLTIQFKDTLTASANSSIGTGCTLTVVSEDSKGIDLNGNNSFTVQAGAYLILQDESGAGTAGTFLYSDKGPDGTTNGEYLNNAGTVTWNGSPSLTDTIGLPVANTGVFKVIGNTSGSGSTLKILDQDRANTNNVSFYNKGGTVSLTNGPTVSVAYGHYQSSGSLTTDQSTCTLQASTGYPNGDINIAGGSVTVDSVANTVGTLKFNCGTVEINGQINVDGQTLKNGKSTFCDLLDCGSAKLTLGTNSFLNVGTTGGFPLGTGNRWTVMKYGSLKNSWGIPPSVPPTMVASTTNTDVLVAN
jgi:hypothetical protein